MARYAHSLPTPHDCLRLYQKRPLQRDIPQFLRHGVSPVLLPLHVRFLIRPKNRPGHNILQPANRRRVHRDHPRRLHHPKESKLKRDNPTGWIRHLRQQILLRKVQRYQIHQTIWKCLWILSGGCCWEEKLGDGGDLVCSGVVDSFG